MNEDLFHKQLSQPLFKPSNSPVNQSPMVQPVQPSNTVDKIAKECEEFLQKARSFETSRASKNSILVPYHDRILFAYDHGMKIITILKTLKAEGVKTSYDNLRSYIRSHKNLNSSKIVKTKKKKSPKKIKPSKASIAVSDKLVQG